MPADEVSPLLVDLVGALRAKGIEVGTSETVDAARTVVLLGMGDRETLREGLAAALVRRESARPVFDALFDLYFPPAPGGDPAEAADDLPTTPDALRAALAEAVVRQDVRLVERLAGTAVQMLGGTGSALGSPTGWSALQTLEAVDVDRVLTLASGTEETGPAGRLLPARSRALLGRFGERVGAEARRRSADVRGRERIVEHSVAVVSAQRDFLNADPREQAEMRRLVRPLARRLARSLAARARRAHRGTIDVRATARASLSTGGKAVAPVYAKRRPRRTRLVVLCDMSGSVAGFSGFTAELLQAVGAHFGGCRVFAFVNTVDEVTDVLRSTGADNAALLSLIHGEATLAVGHHNSDYGRVLREFAEERLSVLGPRTSVLVLGDARNNHRPPEVEALALIASRTHRIFWLNPERRSLWGTGDSAAHDYAAAVPMHECRSPAQLARFVTTVLPV